MEKNIRTIPVTALAYETINLCLKRLATQASGNELEHHKQLLLKERAMIPPPCREAFNTFLFFVDEIINEDIGAMKGEQLDALRDALHDAFNDLVDVCLLHLDAPRDNPCQAKAQGG
jgi:hypothetical protein